jgi:SAM-dependent methyltransferase
MIRKCFLCDVTVDEVSRQRWELPGLPTAVIGFSICPECGLVIQSPSVEPPVMERYYSDIAVYHNPARAGKPLAVKVKGVEKQVQMVRDVVGRVPSSVFQVGCSDGFTLSRFRDAGASVIGGIDPGLSASKVARELYGVETVTGTFEEFAPDRTYQLIISTHVLEHLYDPLESMRKCSSMQGEGGWILVEVPLLEMEDRFPPGYFTFEHLTYFSESTLLRLLSRAGYVPYLVEKDFSSFDYPLITVMACKEDVVNPEVASDFSRASGLLAEYHKKERVSFDNIERRVKGKLKKGTGVYVWGAGIHTSQLFASTDLAAYLSIKGLIDSSPTKWGKMFGDNMCFAPDTVSFKQGDAIVISSYASEDEIYEGLSGFREKGVVVRLYDNP